MIIRSRVDSSKKPGRAPWALLTWIILPATAVRIWQCSECPVPVMIRHHPVPIRFYVNLDSSEGLMLGQHVYIEPDEGQDEKKSGIWLND